MRAEWLDGCGHHYTDLEVPAIFLSSPEPHPCLLGTDWPSRLQPVGARYMCPQGLPKCVPRNPSFNHFFHNSQSFVSSANLFLEF